MGVKERAEELRRLLGIDQKKERIQAIEAAMNEPSFWLSENHSQAESRELKHLQDEVSHFDELESLIDIADTGDLPVLENELNKLELNVYFKGKFDSHNVIINFYAGAGGVDAQDWTEMLVRMYLRWAEINDAAAKIIDESRGEEAGIKSATVEIDLPYAYGKLKGESGVHRLVRQSPFNAKSLRQTSFALVEIMPEIENETEIEIDPKDIRIDVFRSGGHGGQSVNTTDSAVRVTHLPTNIVVTCQNERSQLQNKETALRVLRSRLAKLLLEQHKERINEIRGNFSSPEWGNQIRSYVLHPYKLVKDHRTGHESTQPNEVLLGELGGFIEAEIKWLATQNPETKV